MRSNAAMPQDRLPPLPLTTAYERLLHLLFALAPLVPIGYLYHFQDPALHFEAHRFHELAIGVAIAESVFMTYVTWLCYQDSGERLLLWLTLSFLGFSLAYAPHGALTGLAHHNPALFLLYGPASRVVMNACLLVGVLSHGQAPVPFSLRRRTGFWAKAAAGFVLLDLLIAGLAFSSIANNPWLRLSMEWCALILACMGIAIMIRRGSRLPLLTVYTLSLAFFAQASLAFILAGAWNHQWWLAHAISASGFLLLSYGVIRAFHTTRSFATVYSQEEIMRRLEAANSQAQEAMQQLQAANLELARMAATDALTGISNRRHFLEHLNTEIAVSRRTGRPLSVLAVDLDHFKSINDRHGHQAGDDVLKLAAEVMAANLRASDLVGRMGGEEFAVLLPDTTMDMAGIVAERIRQGVEVLEIPCNRGQMRATVSIGAAQFGQDGEDPNTLLAVADRRLYQAKDSGRNRVIAGGAPFADAGVAGTPD